MRWRWPTPSPGQQLVRWRLEHDFDDLLLTDDGCRRYDPAKERQAIELAGELLIPTKAAINAAFVNKTNAQVASHFGVSIQLAQMRMAGARKIAERAIGKRTGNFASS